MVLMSDNKEAAASGAIRLKKLLDAKQRIEKMLAAEKARQQGNERKAETHLKAALGGGVLSILDDPKLQVGFKIYLLKSAEAGVQKSGLAREKFEALKARAEKEKAAAQAAAQSA
jgi:hypothetical protein